VDGGESQQSFRLLPGNCFALHTFSNIIDWVEWKRVPRPSSRGSAMKHRTIVQLVAIAVAGVSLSALAADPNMPPGPGRQQVMPTMPHSDWHKGQRVPANYRHYNFMLSNWRDHGLHAPPRGHQWLAVNGDYVLVSSRNWTISEIVAGH
jgi:Ni/Co efflux regulator RcnB